MRPSRDLAGKGLSSISRMSQLSREKLRSAGFFEWKGKLRQEAWAILESPSETVVTATPTEQGIIRERELTHDATQRDRRDVSPRRRSCVDA